jgi:hypothetical protein
VPAERTRFYSRLRTLRIAHGLTEFLRDYATAIGEPRSLVIDHVDDADQTDAELVSVLLRRIDPGLLTLVIGTGGAPGGPGARAERSGDPLYGALARHAHRLDAGQTAAPSSSPRMAAPERTGSDPAECDRRQAAAYVSADCIGDRPELKAAYLRLGPAERGLLHDARAAELTATGEFSLRLGAVPYHRERGSDPGGAGAEALRDALDYCIDMGFYEATVDLGRRGRALVDGQAEPDLWWTFTTKMTTSLAALGRAAEAERLYDEARASSASPAVHMQAAYGWTEPEIGRLRHRHALHPPPRRGETR